MRLKNTTDLSNEKIREIIRFVKPNGVSLDQVKITIHNVRSSGHFAGHTDCIGYIYVRITPKENMFPVYHNLRQEYSKSVGIKDNGEVIMKMFTKNGGYLPSLILSREEAFVHLLAHELRHHWQRKHSGRRGKVWGARGRYSERDADAYAIRMQRKWRRMKTEKEVYNFGNWI